MNIGVNLSITGTIVLNPPEPAVTLGELSLSASTVAEDASVGTAVGNIVGRTDGSTLSLQDDAGGKFALDGLAVEVAGALDYETATSHNITVRETLAGATNTPKDTVIAITVTDVSEGPPQPDFANVVFLSAFDSEIGGTVDDESNSNHTITLANGASIDASVKKFGAGSLLFSAPGEEEPSDICYAADSDDWHFGAGAFTAEGWFCWSNYTVEVTYILLSQSLSTGNQRTWELSWTSGSQLHFRAGTNGFVISTKALSAVLPDRVNGQWYHIAADFDGTTYRIYLDGVMVASGGSPITIFNGSGALMVGGSQIGVPPTSSSGPFIGNIDEVRIVKGEAVYASDSGFTPPTEAFPRS